MEDIFEFINKIILLYSEKFLIPVAAVTITCQEERLPLYCCQRDRIYDSIAPYYS